MSRSIRGKAGELSQKPNLCLWGALNSSSKKSSHCKLPRIFAAKIQWPEVGQIPGEAVLLYVGYMGMYGLFQALCQRRRLKKRAGDERGLVSLPDPARS